LSCQAVEATPLNLKLTRLKPHSRDIEIEILRLCVGIMFLLGQCGLEVPSMISTERTELLPDSFAQPETGRCPLLHTFAKGSVASEISELVGNRSAEKMAHSLNGCGIIRAATPGATAVRVCSSKKATYKNARSKSVKLHSLTPMPTKI
jgi:hypothetical protein